MSTNQKPDLPRIQELVLAAIAVPVTEREQYVKDACGDDTYLYNEVTSLLAQADTNFTDLVSESVTKSGLELIRLKVGESVEPYRILRLLGDGGMGRVYLAQQSEPIERKVALKVIKAGMVPHEWPNK